MPCPATLPSRGSRGRGTVRRPRPTYPPALRGAPVSNGTLIVGASQAGLQLAVSLRNLGDTEPITLVGEEAHAPYQRPPLSKEFLSGEATAESLAFRSTAFYADSGITLVSGERVGELALPSSGLPGSGVATTASGRTLPFDRLALTVGAGPRRLSLPGSGLGGICYLRDRDDAAHLRLQLADASRVVVVGGGFIGLEAAAVARALGKSVTVVEAAERLIPRAVAPVVSEFYRQAHLRRGSDMLLSAQVAGFDGADGPGDGGAARRRRPRSRRSRTGGGGGGPPHRARRAAGPGVRPRYRRRLVRPHEQPGRRRRGRLHRAAAPHDGARKGTAGVGPERRGAGGNSRGDTPRHTPGDQGGAVVLVLPGGPQAADRRTLRRLRRIRGARRAGRREVLRPLLPAGRTAGDRRGQQPGRLHGRAQGPVAAADAFPRPGRAMPQPR